MKIMGIDPGEHTGVCVLETEGESYQYATLGPAEHFKELYELIWRTWPDLIICERFQNRGQAAAKLISREYIGVVKFSCEMMGFSLELQVPSQKEWWTDDKLKQTGLWRPGKRHEMDALAHILYYMTFTVEDHTWINRLRG